MSTDRENDAEAEIVSATYRELSVEKTPPELDEAIIAMAKTGRSARRQADNRQYRWTRPVAWVATIGLCLAIVLEVSRQVPTVGYDRAVEPDTPARDGGFQDDTEDHNRGEGRQSIPEDGSNTGTLAERNREALEQLNPVSIVPKTRGDASASPGAPVLPAAEPEGVKAEISAFTTGSPALERSIDEVVGCHKDTRASAELWLECIRKLRRDGKTELATREYTEYLKRFPDKVEAPDTE